MCFIINKINDELQTELQIATEDITYYKILITSKNTPDIYYSLFYDAKNKLNVRYDKPETDRVYSTKSITWTNQITNPENFFFLYKNKSQCTNCLFLIEERLKKGFSFGGSAAFYALQLDYFENNHIDTYNFVIVKAIIPKGAKYLEGANAEIITQSVIYKLDD